MPALLFDLGGTFLRAGLLDSNGQIGAIQKTPIDSVAHRLSEVVIWERLAKCILAYEAVVRSKVPSHASIIISFPGPVLQRKRIVQAPTVAGARLGGFDLVGEIERATGRPVLMLNDISAAAWRLAEITAVNRFLVVTVSSGIGSKIFDRFHPLGVLDNLPYAGEIGHVVVDDSPDAPMCDCGGRGHLGAIASGRGIERCARQYAALFPKLFEESEVVRRFGATLSTLSNYDHIVPAAIVGDEWADGIIVRCTVPLVRSLLIVAMAAGLDRIFIIGGFASALNLHYMQIVRQLARKLSQYQVIGKDLEDLFQPVTTEVCLEGCAAFYRRTGGAL
ncbi:MAG: ROK family protein [Acidobacteriota bacterium]|nr:ROK family protein [Acidobacteriota bacterium]